MVLAYSQDGNLLWTKVIAQVDNGYGFRIASFIKFENSFLIGNLHNYIGRLDAANGGVYWEHFLDHVPGTNMGLLFNPICITNDEKMATVSRVNGSPTKFWFSRFNIETGEMEWDHIVVSPFDDPPSTIDAMVCIPEGGYYVAGGFFNSSDYNIYVMRTDEMGEVTGSYEQNLKAVEVLVYPNPASGDVFIEVNVPDVDNLEIVITDALGRVVKRESGVRNFNVEDVGFGVYFLNIYRGGAFVGFKRIMIW